jgi:PAS domain S-box-containing protein
MNSSITVAESNRPGQTAQPGITGSAPVQARSLITELQQSEERLRRFVAQMEASDALYVLDAHGRIAAWNAAAEFLLGYSAEEICGHDHAALYTMEGDFALKPATALRKAARAGIHRERGWRRRRDGSRCELDVLISPLGLPGTEPVGYTVRMRRAATLISPVLLRADSADVENEIAAEAMLGEPPNQRAA